MVGFNLRQLCEKKEVDVGIELWNSLHPELSLRSELITQNIYAPFAGINVEAMGLEAEGELSAMAVIKYDNKDKKQGWISLAAWTEEVAGADFIKKLEERLSLLGVEKVRFGGDYQNFFPGFYSGLPGRYLEALKLRGFEEGRKVYDLYRDISDFSAPELPSEIEIKRVRKEEEEYFLAFLGEFFPGRWEIEAQNIRRIPGGIEDYFVLFYEGDLAGFARVNRQESPYQGSGINWGHLLGSKYCSLGPLGLGTPYRGQGLSRFFLENLIYVLKQKGYKHLIVDWTDLLDYYHRFGLKPWMEYTCYEKELKRR